MYQLITVVGNIGKDATVRTLDNGAKAISFNVAVNKKYADSNGVPHESITWFNVTKWVYNDGSVEVAKYLKKGTSVLVTGEISAHAYESEKKPQASLDLKVDKLTLLASKKE